MQARPCYKANSFTCLAILTGCKENHFTACHSAKLNLTFTSPNIISTNPKNIFMSRLMSQFFCNLNCSKNFTCPSGRLRTEFTSRVAKSTSPRLLDTTSSRQVNTAHRKRIKQLHVGISFGPIFLLFSHESSWEPRS